MRDITSIQSSIDRFERMYGPIGAFIDNTYTEGICGVCGSNTANGDYRCEHEHAIICEDCSVVVSPNIV